MDENGDRSRTLQRERQKKGLNALKIDDEQRGDYRFAHAWDNMSRAKCAQAGSRIVWEPRDNEQHLGIRDAF